jgi:hypothetical protein
VQLPILGVKKNPQNPLYTQLGVLTKGTVIEVNVSELGLVTTSGKVVWGKYAQITNTPENDGTVNAYVTLSPIHLPRRGHTNFHVQSPPGLILSLSGPPHLDTSSVAEACILVGIFFSSAVYIPGRRSRRAL